MIIIVRVALPSSDNQRLTGPIRAGGRVTALCSEGPMVRRFYDPSKTGCVDSMLL